MLKLPLLLLVLLGTCAAQNSQPLAQLQGSSRVLIVFAPNTSSTEYKRQIQLIERHVFELTQQNTVVVPVSFAGNSPDDHFTGENMPMDASAVQAALRSQYHVQPGQFLVIYLNQDGTEKIRSASPVDIHELTASVDSLPAGH